MLKILLVNDDLQFINLEECNAYENIKELSNILLDKISNKSGCKKDCILWRAQQTRNKNIEKVIKEVSILKELEKLYNKVER